MKAEETNEKLLKSAEELLERKQYDEITVALICKNAGIHRTLFYAYYSDKDEIYNIVLIRYLEHVADEVKKSGDYNNDFTFFREIISKILELVYKKKDLFIDIFSDDGSKKLFNNFYEATVTSFFNLTDYLNLSKENGKDIIAYFYAGAVISCIKWWIKNDFKMPIKDLTNNIIRIGMNKEN